MFTGDVLADKRLRAKLGTGYDIVLANIVADVIIPLAPYARECMAPGGAFITSGIIDGRQDEVAAAINRRGIHNRTAPERRRLARLPVQVSRKAERPWESRRDPMAFNFYSFAPKNSTSFFVICSTYSGTQ